MRSTVLRCGRAMAGNGVFMCELTLVMFDGAKSEEDDFTLHRVAPVGVANQLAYTKKRT